MVHSQNEEIPEEQNIKLTAYAFKDEKNLVEESIMDFAINNKAEQENLEIQQILKQIDRLNEIEDKIGAQYSQ